MGNEFSDQRYNVLSYKYGLYAEFSLCPELLSDEIVRFRYWSDPNLNYRSSFENRAVTMLLFALNIGKGRQFRQFQCHVFHVNQGQYINISFAIQGKSSICRNEKNESLFSVHKWKGPSKYAIIAFYALQRGKKREEVKKTSYKRMMSIEN